jgi:hypothetical protein
MHAGWMRNQETPMPKISNPRISGAEKKVTSNYIKASTF